MSNFPDDDGSAPLTWNYDHDMPHGRNLLLLTVGNVAVIGPWHEEHGLVAWCTIPNKKSALWKRHGDGQTAPSGGRLLVLNSGGTPTISSWVKDAGFIAWCDLPRRPAPPSIDKPRRAQIPKRKSDARKP